MEPVALTKCPSPAMALPTLTPEEIPGRSIAEIRRLKGATMHTGIARTAAVTVASMSELSSYSSSATAQPYGGWGMRMAGGGSIIPSVCRFGFS
jgi:hypothetical protein